MTERLAADPAVVEIEWKTRGHDRAEGLHEALVDAGYVPQEPESIMIGAAELLALDLPLPDDVTLRSVIELEDVRRASFAADRAFDEEPNEARAPRDLRADRGGGRAVDRGGGRRDRLHRPALTGRGDRLRRHLGVARPARISGAAGSTGP